jgi:large subunit ribosomal protein L25
MLESVVFQAEPREAVGKGPARQLRRAGRIPAIVYGGDEAPQKVSILASEVKRQIESNPRFFNSVAGLEIAGKVTHVLPREAQVHPVTDFPLHMDFIRAEAGAMITVEVPVQFIGEASSPGLRRGGVLNIVRRDVELLCPAEAIPDHITVDLGGFDIGDTIHISHVKLPDRVRPTITDRDFTVASIVPPTVTPDTAEQPEGGAPEGEE